MATKTVPRRNVVEEIALILDLPEVRALIEELERCRWTGRRGYPVKSLVGAALAKALYRFPTWAQTERLIREHEGLADTIGGSPSVFALYRFTKKLLAKKELLQGCFDAIADAMRIARPEYGVHVAIDATDLKAYAN